MEKAALPPMNDLQKLWLASLMVTPSALRAEIKKAKAKAGTGVLNSFLQECGLASLDDETAAPWLLLQGKASDVDLAAFRAATAYTEGETCPSRPDAKATMDLLGQLTANSEKLIQAQIKALNRLAVSKTTKSSATKG